MKAYLDALLSTLPKLGAVDAQIVLRDQYESQFGIYDHRHNKSRPLASVGMMPYEDSVRCAGVFAAYEDYAMKNYREIWGLSVEEFMHQPVYIVRMMREITDRVIKRRAAAASGFPGLPKQP